MSIRLALLLALFVPVCAWSQAVTATLLGTVTDPSNASVPNASVTATEVSTGVSRRTVTNTEGIYTIPYLSPGTYRLDVEAPGFKKVVRENLDLRATISTRVDVPLEPGQVSEVIEIRAESPLLQTDRSEVSRSFNTKAVTELPLADRSFQSLVGLMPGIAPPSVDFTRAEDPQGTTFFRANGQGNSANNTQVDGLDNTNPTLGLTIYIPSAEVVQEVNITTTNYNAEFGRAGGAILNVVTRGGTNDFHGSLFEFHRNRLTRARNMFNVAASTEAELHPKRIRRHPRRPDSQEQDVLLRRLSRPDFAAVQHGHDHRSCGSVAAGRPEGCAGSHAVRSSNRSRRRYRPHADLK